jgi:solute carrier family 25 phosphate transporter 23/24/25/41
MIGILPYAGVDIALFEIFKQELFERAEREGRSPPHLSLLVAGMLSSSIAQVRCWCSNLQKMRSFSAVAGCCWLPNQTS